MNARASCLHCGLAMSPSGQQQFCCQGCATVYQLLRDEDLGRFHQLQNGQGAPVVDLPNSKRDLSWIDDGLLDTSDTGLRHFRLDIQGIHCSACVWLLEKTFSRHTGALKLDINPALGIAEFWVDEAFPLENWIRDVERFGYRFGPALKSHDRKSDELLLRLGICVALAINAMMLSVALYLGLNDGRLYEVFRATIYGLSTLAVVVGGPVFMRSAIAGLRNGILHLDVPISLGIVLAFAGSSWGFWTGHDSAMYLDSVSVFIALMLVGRYLQGRVLAANRDRLLKNDGTSGLRSKRVRSGSVETIPSVQILSGDILLIPPGDLIPVESKLLSSSAQISTDWINGESSAGTYILGQSLPAGSFNAGQTAIDASALSNWDASPLDSLLSPSQSCQLDAHEGGISRIVSKYYVAGVLIAAALGFSFYALSAQNPVLGLEVATAVLVVTCPCAFGIATPLAHQLVQSGLKREGLFLRSGNFLNQARKITKIVFDKTGTLTTGDLRILNTQNISELKPEHQQALYQLVSRSSHPTSNAIAKVLRTSSVVLDSKGEVVEYPGQGVEMLLENSCYRLGKGTWAGTGEGANTSFTLNGKVLTTFSTSEETRSDAHDQIQALSNDGYELFLLSGDTNAKVSKLAESMGIPGSHAFGEHTPKQKREWIRDHAKESILFIGDGINDSLAAQEASCSGTPALDRPFMASHCDFYLGTEQLAPLRIALKASQNLHAAIHRNLIFALVYNLCAVSLAWAGLMSPWLAAVLMPTSSILVVLATTFSLSHSRTSWKS